MNEAIILPDFPEETEFEEFIAAHFQCNGFYVERNILKREVEDILELDIIYTSYEDTIPKINIVEVKSGDWGFTDLFKIKGWLVYINESEAEIIVKKGKNSIDFYREKAAELGIRLIHLPSKADTNAHFSKFNQIDSIDLLHWRYSFLLERSLIKYLKQLKKSDRSKRSFEVLDSYYHKIKGGIFFTKNTSERLDVLYNLYRENPNISSRTALEMDGYSFGTEGQIPFHIFNETFYQCIKNPIQISTFIEYISRLAILKNAVDYKIYQANGESELSDKILFQLGDYKISVLDTLPTTIKDGIQKLSEHKYFNRYPIFWQWFIYLFGGFILLDYKNEEYQIISQKTGIPIEEIDNALSVFDILFPTQGGWYLTPSNYNIKLLKAFPMPFRGIAANYRRLHYLEGDDKPYKNLKLTKQYTLSNLITWNNLAYKIMKTS